jgi:hypothetical protein
VIHWKQWLGAFIWTLLWVSLVVFVVGITQISDCAAPAEPCRHMHEVVGLSGLAIGLAVLLLVNWLILRRRKN